SGTLIDIFNMLPDVCLLHIFKYLSDGDRSRASLVCHHWHKIMRHNLPTPTHTPSHTHTNFLTLYQVEQLNHDHTRPLKNQVLLQRLLPGKVGGNSTKLL
uniref:F-box domain-containing protein n=1 Tax=Xiphophorus couchianus TaxID=32473 RepID=A0A3B5MWG6_9TELE